MPFHMAVASIFVIPTFYPKKTAIKDHNFLLDSDTELKM